MSLTTWTPAAIASKATHFTETLCRFVVKNSHSSIAKITDSNDELIRVENAITRQVNNFDNEFADLHPLMKLPFIAKAYPRGSRFRGQFDAGVFYGANTIETAAAERGYHHHVFVRDSPGLVNSGATPFTFFTVKISMKLVDVRKVAFSKHHSVFYNKKSYADSQRFASSVRESDVPGIKYASVRNLNKGSCVAMFSPSGFELRQPTTWDEDWLCLADSNGARWINNSVAHANKNMQFTY